MAVSHYVETYDSRYFPSVVEIYCSEVDETKGVIGEGYTRHCPMCGREVVVDGD